MVSVGSKVVVTPLDGQPGTLAVIGVGGGAGEGNYNTWTFEWRKNILRTLGGVPTSDFPGDGTAGSVNFFVDDSNDVMHITWQDCLTYNTRYGIFACADFANLLVTPNSAIGLTVPVYTLNVLGGGWKAGVVESEDGISRTIQTYTLLATKGAAGHGDGLNVYKNSSLLWTHSIESDLPAPQNTDGEVILMEISTTGKYILLSTFHSAWPDYYSDLLLYKGSFIEP